MAKPLHPFEPDVSVRGIGVMEKCTFCVQRIQAAQIDFQSEHAEPWTATSNGLRRGLLGAGAGLRRRQRSGGEVARLARLPRGERLLEDLGTLPNVTYLTRQTGA